MSSALVKEWLDIIEIKYSKHTFMAYKQDLLTFLEFYKYYIGKDIYFDQSIDIKIWRSWISYLKSKLDYTNQSVCRAISSMRNFIKYLHKSHDIKIDSIYFLKMPRFKPKIFKDIEAEHLINCLADLPMVDWIDIRNKVMMFILYSTGIRISELLSIKNTSIQDNKIMILGKGNKYRTVVLLDEVRKLLDSYLSNIPFDLEFNDYIFRGAKGGVLQDVVFRKYVQNLRRKLGLPEYVSPHLLRHCFARHLLDNNMSLLSVSKALGHKNLSSTERYIHMNQKRMVEAYDKFYRNM